MGNAEHGTNYYVKIYATLVASVASVIVVGPIIGNFFAIMGVALVIAVFKASFFLHLNVEKRWVWLYLITALVCLFAFFFGSARDVLMHEGMSWKRCNAMNEQTRERIAHQTAHVAESRPDLAAIGLPPGADCVEQRF